MSWRMGELILKEITGCCIGRTDTGAIDDSCVYITELVLAENRMIGVVCLSLV